MSVILYFYDNIFLQYMHFASIPENIGDKTTTSTWQLQLKKMPFFRETGIHFFCYLEFNLLLNFQHLLPVDACSGCVKHWMASCCDMIMVFCDITHTSFRPLGVAIDIKTKVLFYSHKDDNLFFHGCS